MKTVASIFGGFGGFEYGAMAAGLTPLWTVECDPAIAVIYSLNVGTHALVARAEDVDYSRLARPDWLHMSPVCTNASVAKTGAGETEADREMARACARAIVALMPDEVSLENVWGYRNFDSFRIVTDALTRCGYYFNFWHLNAADYGVPQTRKRLILLASLRGRPYRPTPTHSKCGDLFTARWVGWYEAINDLIPTLPESKFAPWQLKRLPDLHETALVRGDNSRQEVTDGRQYRPTSEPAATVRARAWTRAFIVEATAAGVDNKFTMPVRSASEPIFTVRPGPNIPRAFLVTEQYQESNATASEDRKPQTFEPEQPCPTVLAEHKGRLRAWLSGGRVVGMTPRAHARFQSIPDEVVLPDHNGLAFKVVGNAVPSLLARRMVESRIEARQRAAA